MQSSQEHQHRLNREKLFWSFLKKRRKKMISVNEKKFWKVARKINF